MYVTDCRLLPLTSLLATFVWLVDTFCTTWRGRPKGKKRTVVNVCQGCQPLMEVEPESMFDQRFFAKVCCDDDARSLLVWMLYRVHYYVSTTAHYVSTHVDCELILSVSYLNELAGGTAGSLATCHRAPITYARVVQQSLQNVKWDHAVNFRPSPPTWLWIELVTAISETFATCLLAIES